MVMDPLNSVEVALPFVPVTVKVSSIVCTKKLEQDFVEGLGGNEVICGDEIIA